MKAAIDAGYRHIDCAPTYQNENEVGEAIQEKIQERIVRREDLFIVSKVHAARVGEALISGQANISGRDQRLDLISLPLSIPVSSSCFIPCLHINFHTQVWYAEGAVALILSTVGLHSEDGSTEPLVPWPPCALSVGSICTVAVRDKGCRQRWVSSLPFSTVISVATMRRSQPQVFWEIMEAVCFVTSGFLSQSSKRL